MKLHDIINSIRASIGLLEKTKRMNTFTSLEEIGLTQGTETIDDIVNHLPPYSTLIYQVASNYGNSSIYPLSSGIVQVDKMANNGRVSFKFINEYESYEAYYNDFYGSPFIKWSQVIKGIKSSNIQDINLIDQTCVRYCTPSTPNLPEPSTSFYVATILNIENTNYIKQMAYGATGANAHRAFIREKVGGTWSSWRIIIAAFQGSGSPEGVVTAPIGSFYINNSGGTTTTLYIKTSGTGNTGWTAK